MSGIVATFGDSHFAGSEIEFEGQDMCYHKCFSAKLAERLNYSSVNYAYPGGSNYWSLNEFNNFIKDWNGEKALVIFGITDSARTFFWDDSYDVPVPWHAWPGRIDFKSSIFDKVSDEIKQSEKHKRFLSLYLNFLKENSIEQLDIKTFDICCHVKKECEKRSIPFLIVSGTMAVPGLWTKEFNESNFFRFDELETYNKKKYYKLQTARKSSRCKNIDESEKISVAPWQSTYWYWAQHSKTYKEFVNKGERTSYSHASEETHEEFAEVLFDYIKEQKVLQLDTSVTLSL
jgi:hypothetical protein